MSRKTIFTFGGATKGASSTGGIYDTVKKGTEFTKSDPVYDDPRLKELYEALLAKTAGQSQRETSSENPL